MTMTEGVTFDQAFSATAFTGKQVFSFADDYENPYISGRKVSAGSIVSSEPEHHELELALALTERSSTLLQHSSMYQLIGGFLKEAETFAFPEQSNGNSPRDAVARIGNYLNIENPDELAIFFARNGDITTLVERAARKAICHPKFSSGEVCVFSEPGDKDYSVYINAEFSFDDYDLAYQLECSIFDDVIKPQFKLVDYRIFLSFDTDSND